MALLAVACGPTTEPPEAADPTTEERPVRTVVTQTVESTVLRDVVALSAEVVPWAAVTVAAEGAGRVVEVLVEEGDSVVEGQVLARLDDAEVRSRLAQSEAQLAEAEALVVQAERDTLRGREMHETSDISLGELEQLELSWQTTQARRDAAVASVELARQAVTDTTVRAPFAGVVSERRVEVGSWLSPGAPVLRLLDRRRLKVRGAATQGDRARLDLGLAAEVRADALAGATWQGPVRLLGQEADPRTGTYGVEIEITEPTATDGRRLLPGMQAEVVIEVGTRQALTLPRSALVETAEGSVLFVFDQGVARRIVPELGEAVEERFEVLRGLEEGQAVIVAGQHVLRDGDRVATVASEGGGPGETHGEASAGASPQ